jgi:hypothetical protein
VMRALVMCAVLLVPASVMALPFDLRLASLGDGDGSVNSKAFEGLVHDLGLAVRPHVGASGATVGMLGFDVAYGVSVTDIDATAAHWSLTAADPSDLMVVSQVSVRKGLPYSVELGATLSHLHDSPFWGIGLELKWAFVEGFELAPDIAARLHASTVIGSRDLTLVTAGSDLLVSKRFGIGGVVQLVPFAGYSMTYVFGASRVLGHFDAGALVPETFLLPDQHVFTHRGLVGLRLTATVADIAIEASLGDVMTYSARLGLTF